MPRGTPQLRGILRLSFHLDRRPYDQRAPDLLGSHARPRPAAGQRPYGPAPATRAIRPCHLATSRRPASRQQRRPLPSGLALRRTEISRELTVAGRTQAPPQQHGQITRQSSANAARSPSRGTHNKAAVIEHGASTKPIDTNPQNVTSGSVCWSGRAGVPKFSQGCWPCGAGNPQCQRPCGTARRVPLSRRLSHLTSSDPASPYFCLRSPVGSDFAAAGLPSFGLVACLPVSVLLSPTSRAPRRQLCLYGNRAGDRGACEVVAAPG